MSANPVGCSLMDPAGLLFSFSGFLCLCSLLWGLCGNSPRHCSSSSFIMLLPPGRLHHTSSVFGPVTFYHSAETSHPCITSSRKPSQVAKTRSAPETERSKLTTCALASLSQCHSLSPFMSRSVPRCTAEVPGKVLLCVFLSTVLSLASATSLE